MYSVFSTRAYAFFEDMEGVREWEEKFAELGPLVFGLHDGQSEAPKVSISNLLAGGPLCSAQLVLTRIECSHPLSSQRLHAIPFNFTLKQQTKSQYAGNCCSAHLTLDQLLADHGKESERLLPGSHPA